MLYTCSYKSFKTDLYKGISISKDKGKDANWKKECYLELAKEYYAKKICGIVVKQFIKTVILPSTFVLILSLLFPYFMSLYSRNLYTALIFFILEAFWIIAVIYFVGLNSVEKQFVKDIIKKICKK